MQDLELLSSLPLSTPFQSFGGWVNGQALLKEYKRRTLSQTYSHYIANILTF